MSTTDAPAADQLTVGVMGLGYLGAVHTACMAALGHRVIGYDIDVRKVDALRRAEAPFFEPGLAELLARTPTGVGRASRSRRSSRSWPARTATT